MPFASLSALIVVLTQSPFAVAAFLALVALGAAFLRWFAHQPKDVRADVVRLIRALLRRR